MANYIARRVMQMVVVFFGVMLLMFVLTSVLPGDPVKIRAGERYMSPATRAAIEQKYGLDKPLWQQYLIYLRDLSRGDFGESYRQNRNVADIFKDLYPNTALLAVCAIIVEILIGIGAGVISAVKRGRFVDWLVTLSTSILVSLPVFWLGMLMQRLFGLQFKQWGLPYLPISGMGGDGLPLWTHLIMPSIVLASVSTAYAARIMRSQLLEVNNQDYIRTAHAKGLTSAQVTWKHAMKNALIPVVTFIALDFGALMSGAILTETVFNWPGVGHEVYAAIGQRDWPVVMGGVVVIVIVVMVVNLLTDISYALLDPRIRYDSGASS
ncbi:MAG: ABC transporter permease [Actinobacteria bacterium]|nr:MAG: ABC transporter permease [Actinomycetota bacterium]